MGPTHALVAAAALLLASADAADELVIKQYGGPTECADEDKVVAGKQLGMHYTGTIDESSKTGTPGKKFDSSRDRGQVFQTKIGVGQVIRGWDEGVMKMSLGEKATLAIPSVWLVAGGTPPQMGLGIAVGLLSAFLVAIFGALNKTLAREADPYTLTAVEFVAGLGVLGLGIALTSPAVLLPGPTDLGWLLLLALGCTLAPFVMAFVALRTLTAWAAQLVVNLEPVYAVALAALLLGEGAQLTWPFYLGLALLIAVTASAARAPR